MHTESEDRPWKITIPGHAPRSDSPRYRHSAGVLKNLVAAAAPGMYGPPPAEDHHGGGLWVWEHDDPEHGKPFLLVNIAGIEWSGQFLCDPGRVDLLRLNALLLYEMFPRSIAALDAMGCEASTLLNAKIVDAAGIANWVDSIFNASVPLPKAAHTGLLPASGGRHHYPAPICDLEAVKRDDYVLWVDDGTGVKVAVVPIAPRGSGVDKVAVLYAPPQSELHPIYADMRKTGELVVLDGDHPMAQAAFAKQTSVTQSVDN